MPTIKESVVTPGAASALVLTHADIAATQQPMTAELPTADTTERIADRHPPADRRRQRNCEFIGLKIAELLSQVKLIFTARSDWRLARRNAGESMGSHGTTCGQFRWRAERR
ncbi:hypothetical protein MPSD_36600 [Mycobacterium pseudoshottsii JCM 15466]|uniref:Uncharacterized protein n=1 Tax=Mycobacterium pseudoshottsii TaxID=265949 RepID=A0A9N7QPR1_9MYCO|nr:hypothetical protein MPSD_36600 [Mycobacterium pseudoshottsii JCM 15466]BDN83380.1 hypothetical protein NJB1907Z4_C35950 [Mycobacterium pseudoshottsii]